MGGLLAKRFADVSGRAFESQPIYRRPEVYIVQPEFFHPEIRLQEAKFTFWLTESEATHAFYVEKNWEEMDDSWDWNRFISSARSAPEIWDHIADVITRRNLEWVTEIKDHQQVHKPTLRLVSDGNRFVVRGDDGQVHRIEYLTDFVKILDAIGEDCWCDLYLWQRIPKKEAISYGVGIANRVIETWNELLPLYSATVGNR